MVTDGAGNIGNASQLLTVDTVLPIVSLDGGATVATNDPTPTISGVSDVTAGTLVQVGVDAQTLVAVVQHRRRVECDPGSAPRRPSSSRSR